MKRWALPIIVCYLLAVAGHVAIFSGAILDGPTLGHRYNTVDDLLDVAKNIFPVVLVLVAGGALLLCVRVDRHVRPARTTRSLVVPVAAAIVLFLVLAGLIAFCLAAGIWGDNIGKHGGALWMFMAGLGTWVLWAACFLVYTRIRRADNVVRRAVNWLLVGSVLEVLVAVPCHIVARQRHDCCAPIMTMWGICMGVTIMLICLGPGVVFLYMDRMASKKARNLRCMIPPCWPGLPTAA